MLQKTLLALSCLCLAQAVFVINAPDDEEAVKFVNNELESEEDSTVSVDFSVDTSPESSASPRACTHALCHQFCRSRGYARGHCISANICRCYLFFAGLSENLDASEAGVDINKDDNDDADQINNADAADDYSVEQVAAEEGASSLASARACTNAACHRFCQSRGYARGQCISANVCRCYRFWFAANKNQDPSDTGVDINKDDDDEAEKVVKSADKDEKTEDFSVGQMSTEEGSASPRACTHALCHQFCRSRGYARDHCISANVCRCYLFFAGLSENKDASENGVEINKDDNNDAQHVAKVADKVEQSEDYSVGQISAEEGLPSTRACTHALCHQFCRSRGYARGHCISANVCRCYLFFAGLSENVDASESGVEINKDDNNDAKNVAKVADKVEQSEDYSVGQLSAEEGLPSTRACTHALCHQFCRSRGYARGHCISANVCRCYLFFAGLSKNVDASKSGVEINKDDNNDAQLVAKVADKAEQSEDYSVGQISVEEGLPSTRACTHALCHQFCRSRGYARGHCISANICRCYLFYAELSESLNDAENAVDIMKDVEADNELPADNLKASPRACVTSACNRSCRAKGFTRGVCVNANTCQCYKENVPLMSNVIDSRDEKQMERNAYVLVEEDNNAEQALLKENLESEPVAFVSYNDCNPLWCAQTCRRMGFPDGVCVNGRCKCDIL